MRGPGMRLKLDVRRLWQCPRCGTQRKLPADVTTVRCNCVAEPTFMRIVEPQRRVRAEPKPLNPVLVIDLDTPDENEIAAAAASVVQVTEVVSEVVVQSAIAAESEPKAAPPPGDGPPPRRDDRRNKPRHQRDRRGQGNRPRRNPGSLSGSAPAESQPPPAAPLPPNDQSPPSPLTPGP